MLESPENSQNQTSSDYVEEEILVYVDIEQTSISENEIKEAKCLKIATNDKSSIIQINNRFFEGNYDYSIGTHVFFEKNDNANIDPLYSRCDSQYDFKAKTSKILSMNRVLLKDETLHNDEDLQLEDKDLKITRTYEQALSLFLNSPRSPPRKANEDDEKILLDIIKEKGSEEEISTLTDAMEQNNLMPDS